MSATLCHCVCNIHCLFFLSAAGAYQGMAALAQRAARDSWETLINQTYIQPFLKVCRIFTSDTYCGVLIS